MTQNLIFRIMILLQQHMSKKVTFNEHMYFLLRVITCLTGITIVFLLRSS